MEPSDPTADYPVTEVQPVRWGDMDAYQHLNNAKYLTYFESVRMRYFTRTGITPAAGLPSGVGPIVASQSCRYKAPVRWPDRLTVGVRVTELGEDRFTMQYIAVSEQLGRVAATGEVLVVSYDYSAGHKVPLPEAWRRAIEELERGA